MKLSLPSAVTRSARNSTPEAWPLSPGTASMQIESHRDIVITMGNHNQPTSDSISSQQQMNDDICQMCFTEKRGRGWGKWKDCTLDICQLLLYLAFDVAAVVNVVVVVVIATRTAAFCCTFKVAGEKWGGGELWAIVWFWPCPKGIVLLLLFGQARCHGYILVC